MTRKLKTLDIKCKIDGCERNAMEWSRQPNVKVAHNTIVRRIKKGWSVERALFTNSLTHPNVKVKAYKTKYKNQFELNGKGIQLD